MEGGRGERGEGKKREGEGGFGRTGVLMKRTPREETDTHREHGVKTERRPLTSQGGPEATRAGRGREQILSQPSEGITPADALILDFQPPDLRRGQLPLPKPPSWRESAMAAVANGHTVVQGGSHPTAQPRGRLSLLHCRSGAGAPGEVRNVPGLPSTSGLSKCRPRNSSRLFSPLFCFGTEPTFRGWR